MKLLEKKNASRAENTSKYRNAAMKHLDIKGSGANVNDNQLIVGFYKELRWYLTYSQEWSWSGNSRAY